MVLSLFQEPERDTDDLWQGAIALLACRLQFFQTRSPLVAGSTESHLPFLLLSLLLIFVRVRGAVTATINNGSLIEQGCVTLWSGRRVVHAIKEDSELIR